MLLKAEKYLLTHPAFSRVRVEDVKKRRVERENKIKELREEQAKKKAAKAVEESPIKKEEQLSEPNHSSRKTQENPRESTSGKEKGGFMKKLFGEDPKK